MKPDASLVEHLIRAGLFAIHKELREKYSWSLPCTWRVHESLQMGGETYTSAISGRGLPSSFVGVTRPVVVHDTCGGTNTYFEDGSGKTVVEYGQVQFYFRHLFLGRWHYFAAMKFFTRIVIRGPGVESYYPESVEYADNYFPKIDPYPSQPDDKVYHHDKYIIVPVHTICCRWFGREYTTKKEVRKIPGSSTTHVYTTWIVSPIPSKLHA